MQENSDPSALSTTQHPHPQFHLPHLFRTNLVLLLVMLLIGGFVGYFIASLQAKTQQTISVQGKASQTLSADSATLTGNTKEYGKTIEGAIANNKLLFEAIKKKLLQIGINEKDIIVLSTTNNAAYYDELNATAPESDSKVLPTSAPVPAGSSIMPTPAPSYGPTFYCAGNSPCTENGYLAEPYSAGTEFKVMLNKVTIPKADAILDMFANYGLYPTIAYNLSDRNTVLLQNKEKAIQDARAQAEALAKVNKSVIKKVVGIKEITPSADTTYSSVNNDPTTDSYTKDINFSSTFEVTYELSPALFGL